MLVLDSHSKHQTVAWLHEISCDPTWRPDLYVALTAEERLAAAADDVRVGIAKMVIAAAFRSHGLRPHYKQSSTPLGAESPWQYPAGWHSIHAHPEVGEETLRAIADGIKAGITDEHNSEAPAPPGYYLGRAATLLGLNQEELNPSGIVHIAPDTLAMSKLWVPDDLAQRIDPA